MSAPAIPPTVRFSVAEFIGFVLPPFTLSAWGIVMIHTFVTGRTKMLLHPFFQPLIAVAGGLLLLLAIAHLCYFVSRLGRILWLQWLALLLPLLFGAFTAPASYSDKIVTARGIQSGAALTDSSIPDSQIEATLRDLAVADPAKPFPMDVVDLVSSSGVPTLTQKLENRAIHLRGQYYKVNGSEFKLLRLMMYCCAADASPIGVLVHGEVPEGTKNMDWLEVEGPVNFVQSLGTVRPEVNAQLIQPVPAPKDPYAY